MLRLLVPLAMLLALAFSDVASANGDAVEIFRGRGGPYEVVVRILPEKPLVGTVHISITPLDAATSLTVTDAEIIVVADDERGKPTYQARALNTPASPQYYEANITFASPGKWTLRVEVESETLGKATVAAPLEIGENPLPSGTPGTLIWLLVFFTLVGGATYVWYSTRRARGRGTRD